jgi:hypothetical protein
MIRLRKLAGAAVLAILATLPGHRQGPEAAAPPVRAETATLARLIEQLGSDNFAEREEAAKALVAIGHPALAALRHASAHHPDLEVRLRAKRVAGEFENTPAALLAAYLDYGLPLPPKDAQLVRATWSHEPHLAFAPGPKAPTPDPSSGEYVPLPWPAGDYGWGDAPFVDPDRATPREMDEWVRADCLPSLLVAIQCQARGWDLLARKLLDKYRKYFRYKKLAVALACLAWDYWEGQLTAQPVTNWPRVAGRLRGLRATWDHLDTTENRTLLKSLDAALVPSKARPGSVEALIDDLIDEPSPSLEVKPGRPLTSYQKLAALGFTAVPALLAHRNDDRLTRHLCSYLAISTLPPPPHRYRVGDMANELLSGLGAGDNPRAWWAKASKGSEEAYLLARVLPAGESRMNDHMLHVLTAKYPRHLPRLYRTILDKRSDVYSEAVAQAITRSSLPHATKVELFVHGTRNKYPDHRVAAFTELAALGSPCFRDLLIKALSSFPRYPSEDRAEWSIAMLVQYTDDRRVWQTLEKVARRSGVGLRMEIISASGAFAGTGIWRQRRLAFLTAFLADPAAREPRAPTDKWSEEYPWLEVRNLAAMEIAWVLKWPRKEKPSWTAKEWAAFRAQVRQALDSDSRGKAAPPK